MQQIREAAGAEDTALTGVIGMSHCKYPCKRHVRGVREQTAGGYKQASTSLLETCGVWV